MSAIVAAFAVVLWAASPGARALVSAVPRQGGGAVLPVAVRP